MNTKTLTIFSVFIFAAMVTACTLDGTPTGSGGNGISGNVTPAKIFDGADTNCSLEASLADTAPLINSGGAPVILYTDIASGPTSGGEGNNGAYLSIFGTNFGPASALGTTTKVFIDDVEVADYILMKNARAQTMPIVDTIQQITVQVGALVGATPGVDLPIKLMVNGVLYDTDKTFMIQPGDIYYVDNVNGVEIGVKNDPAQPYRYVQSKTGIKGVLNDFAGPGDFVVMRGTGTEWTDLVGQPGQERFIRFNGITGNAPTGTPGNGPITIMGYPGEDVVIQCQDDTRCGIHGVDGFSSTALRDSSDWITISNLRIFVGGARVKDGPINLQHKSDNWRIVNNELFDWNGNNIDRKILDVNGNAINGNIATGTFSKKGTADKTFTDVDIVDGITPIGAGANGSTNSWEYESGEILDSDGQVIVGTSFQEARAGGITGDGNNVKILGNHIHDINGGTKNHGIYVDGGAQNWEIAYNNIGCSFGGNIIQTFDSGGYGNIRNIDIHHNRLHDGTRYGVNYSTATTSGKVYDNLIYNIAAGGLRFSTTSGSAIIAVHNTLYNNCLKTGVNSEDISPTTKIPANAAAVANDAGGQGIKIQNNILHSHTNCSSYIGNTGNYNTMVIDNNLYAGLSAGSASSKDAAAVEGDPEFVNVAIGDLRLGADSDAIDAAAAFGDFAIPTDYLVNSRVTGGNADIGAIEN